MKAQRTYCVSHDAPLVPPGLFDYAIGLGDYRPDRGTHISQLDEFWDNARPVAYGAAGNYVIPRAIARDSLHAELTGIFSHRKIVVRNSIGREAAKYPVYREVSPTSAALLGPEDVRPREGFEFLIGVPIRFPYGVLAQYIEKHHAVDLFDYLSMATAMGMISPNEVQEIARGTIFIPGGCELGVYPTAWLSETLSRLAALGRAFVERHARRLRAYDSYQVRAVGFLAERLGSFFLLAELRRRYPQGLPRALFGHLCVIVDEDAQYEGARAAN